MQAIRTVSQFAHEGHEIAQHRAPITTAIIDAPMWVAGRVLAGAGTVVNTGTRFVETQTRRGLRDRLGLSKDAAQDVGDVVGFLAGFAVPTGPAKAGRAVAGITAEVSQIARVTANTNKMVSKAAQSSAGGAAPAAAATVSSGPTVQTLKRAHSAVIKGELKYMSSPYNPRQTLEDLHSVYPGRVTSTTVPAQHQPNVRLANTRHPVTGVVFDQRGLPIFDSHAKVDLKIDKAKALVSGGERHKREATRQLRDMIQSGQLDTSQFTPQQLRDIQGGFSQITDLSWHHHQDIGRMQLVPREIHRHTPHVGGDHLWFQ